MRKHSLKLVVIGKSQAQVFGVLLHNDLRPHSPLDGRQAKDLGNPPHLALGIQLHRLISDFKPLGSRVQIACATLI